MKLIRQCPICERSSLIKCIGLLLDQLQIMQWVEDEWLVIPKECFPKRKDCRQYLEDLRMRGEQDLELRNMLKIAEGWLKLKDYELALEALSAAQELQSTINTNQQQE